MSIDMPLFYLFEYKILLQNKEPQPKKKTRWKSGILIELEITS